MRAPLSPLGLWFTLENAAVLGYGFFDFSKFMAASEIVKFRVAGLEYRQICAGGIQTTNRTQDDKHLSMDAGITVYYYSHDSKHFVILSKIKHNHLSHNKPKPKPNPT